MPHRDPRHTKLLHQGQLARQPGIEVAVPQSLAQHQVDLVVLRQGQLCVHAAIVRQTECSVNRTFKSYS